jgi:hypothetical protein
MTEHHLVARAADLGTRFGTATVRDPRGGLTTVHDAVTRMAEAHSVVDADERRGSRRHDRISRGQRWLVRILPCIDGLVLLWFVAGVLNVDPRYPDPTALVAVAFAVLGTVAVAAWSAAVGEQLRRFKDADRALVWLAVDPLRRAMVAVSLAMTLLLAALMYVRVSDEVYEATGQTGTLPTVVAVVLAAAVALVNLYVLHCAFADGSPETTDLDRLGRALRKHVRRHERAVAAEAAAVRKAAAKERLRS